MFNGILFLFILGKRQNRHMETNIVKMKGYERCVNDIKRRGQKEHSKQAA